MEVAGYSGEPVLVTGTGMLAHSVAVCLIKAGHPVSLYTKNKSEALRAIGVHFCDLERATGRKVEQGDFRIIESLGARDLRHKLAISLTGEDVAEKKTIVQQLEKKLPPYAVIAINTESVPIEVLQNGCAFPGRVIGLNWVEPAHTTYFLEIITGALNHKTLVDAVLTTAKKSWNKDPYIVNNGVSIRSKLLAAMAREAFYLVENGYASVEDIDKSCRNDAGYYLPFAGNFRYMDLMGTASYGIVMKDLNRELSKQSSTPFFFRDIVEKGGLGMENDRGFYTYENGDTRRWNEAFRKFSYQIQRIISRYPFNGTK